MSKTLRISLLIGAVAVVAGCSATGHASSAGEPTWAAAQSPAASSAPAQTPAPVAKLTAACPLLSANELKTLLGGTSSQTKVEAVEDKPDMSDGSPTYTCEYGSKGSYPFALSVLPLKPDNFSPQKAVDAIATSSHVTTHKVTGVGEAGVFYTKSDGYSIIAVAKLSHGEIRSLVFAAPKIVPEQKFIDIAHLVIDRI
jgi:hypothetical protein